MEDKAYLRLYRCYKCGKTPMDAKGGVIFSIEGSIMATSKNGEFGGIIGSNIAKGSPKKWEKQRSHKIAESKDKTLRLYAMHYCKTCLINAILKTR